MRKFLALLAAVCILSLVGCTVSSDGDLQKEIAYESRIQAEQSSIMAHIAESDAAIKTTRTFGKEPLQSYLGYR
ncbi:MAG: hypothetical protein LBS96_08145, partial [Oscillospiraceae bacterium]|nr:hypothetical protein [Oscillospiraceae bacterium]